MPRWASMIAALAPVGPAPTMTTGTWVVVMASPHPVVLGAEVDSAVGGPDPGRDPVAGLEVGAAARLAATNRSQRRRSGRRPMSRCTRAGGGCSATPPGVPVSSRSPTSSRSRPDHSVRVAAGPKTMSPARLSWRTAPLTERVSRSSRHRATSSGSGMHR